MTGAATGPAVAVLGIVVAVSLRSLSSQSFLSMPSLFLYLLPFFFSPFLMNLFLKSVPSSLDSQKSLSASD